ncbi:MAG: glutamate synthase subunit beta [Acidimicrobiia bacterium]|nr:glutamate synthase subunit beta [Acidimicrobiia bacterium]MDH3396944.1 glutamate synthase subunit beta [Acidimicrobiia bacterium]MDH5616047.1 glutamate synthase subunit beta [Acidimicrobiia bacterium]
MGSPTGFRDFERQDRTYLPVEERLEHYHEFVVPLRTKEVARQGARCMDCGTPYCHQGCPVDNIIPDWNDLISRDRWREAIEVLHSTNNFPEFTGRVCPAPCEEACTLNLHDAPVTIKTIEHTIIERAWKERWIQPQISARRTGRTVAIVGSGPSGLACAQQLARAGHQVTVYEKNAQIGGLLRYGIPDFKLSKSVINRRMSQMQAEGVDFRVNSHIGLDIPVEKIVDEYDAVVLTGGCERPQDLQVPGRELGGIHFAMPFLTQQNRRLAGEPLNGAEPITAESKHVIVIGGGDTGSDCVGTANRQKAASVTQLEVLPRPPEQPDKLLVWPNWPTKLRTSSSHAEGCDRRWSVATTAFSGTNGTVARIHGVQVDWTRQNGSWQMQNIEGTAFDLEADLVLLAMGFVSPVRDGLLQSLRVEFDGRGNVLANSEDYQTSAPAVFAAGDMRRGQSLVVWAIREGRQCARAVDEFLMGFSDLPR